VDEMIEKPDMDLILWIHGIDDKNLIRTTPKKTSPNGGML